MCAETPRISISLRIDGASMVYGAIVSVLWPLVTAYSLDYMSHEGHENRFFAFWLMAYGVVLGIAYSEDFLTLYFFYEVLTLTTLPLVMHAMDEKARYAGRKYLVYSLSGAAFAFIGIVFLLNYGVGHLNFTYGGILDQSLAAGNERTLELVFVAAFFGFGVKAAVFPFHGWLPDASVAPTPVSALLHAVAVVKAGAFAVLRLIYYGFGADFLRGSWAQTVVMTAAIVTIVYGSARALRTPHLKRRLAFSTVSNLSYILFALTLMTPAGMVGGMTHMVYHAFTKITMFCCAGAIILKSGKEYIYEMEDFGRAMPVVFATFTVSSFALIGMPPLGGFAGKWMIAEAAVASVNPLAYAGIAALILSTLLTTLYMLTIVVRAYFPVGELDRAALARVHDPARTMWIPLVPDKRFVGLDAYKQVIDSGVDVVIVATPPVFRPVHFQYATEKGKHSFLEKPICVDPVGYRTIMATAKQAAAKNLCVVTGTQRHHQRSYVESYKKIMEGLIGEITGGTVYWNQNMLWYRDRQPGWNDCEYMIKDWVNWKWLSGDHIVEQHVHNIDVFTWFSGLKPVKAVGFGSRHRRITGDQYDNFSVDFTMENGIHMHSMCRQIDGCANNVSEFIQGTKGSWSSDTMEIKDLAGNVIWKYDSEAEKANFKQTDPYTLEHVNWINCIRGGKQIEQASETAISNMAAIMGRESAYTGAETTWDAMTASALDYTPKDLNLGKMDMSGFVVPVPGKPIDKK